MWRNQDLVFTIDDLPARYIHTYIHMYIRKDPQITTQSLPRHDYHHHYLLRVHVYQVLIHVLLGLLPPNCFQHRSHSPSHFVFRTTAARLFVDHEVAAYGVQALTN
jgi:hypothetical protein